MPQTRQNAARLDDQEKVFFKRQVEKVKSKTYDKKFKNLKAKMFLPVSTEAGPGADYIIWYSFSKAGMAKIIADYAHDFPRVDVFATENQSRVKGIGASYGYNIQEIRRAQMAGVPLNQRRADASRRAIEEKIDNVAWYGDSDFNIQGFFDYPGITEYTIPNGASGDTEWSTKTPDEIVADLSGIRSAITVPTKGREEPNQWLIPRSNYELINQTRMTDGTDKTILSYFLSNNPGISIDPLDELEGQGTGGSNRMMCYVKDPNNVTLEIPQPFEQFEEDKVGMEYVVPVHARIGGVIVYYPQSVAFADEI
jgi:hypothetical protein